MAEPLPGRHEALGSILQYHIKPPQWCPIIPALGRKRQENHKFSVILDYTVGLEASLGHTDPDSEK